MLKPTDRVTYLLSCNPPAQRDDGFGQPSLCNGGGSDRATPACSNGLQLVFGPPLPDATASCAAPRAASWVATILPRRSCARYV